MLNPRQRSSNDESVSVHVDIADEKRMRINHEQAVDTHQLEY